MILARTPARGTGTRGFGDLADDIRKALMPDGANPLSAVISSVEFRSTLGPPIRLSGDALWKGQGAAPSWIGERVKPTLVLSTPVGQQVIAPYGAAGPDDWQGNVGIMAVLGIGGALVLLGIGYALGRR